MPNANQDYIEQKPVLFFTQQPCLDHNPLLLIWLPHTNLRHYIQIRYETANKGGLKVKQHNKKKGKELEHTFQTIIKRHTFNKWNI